MWREFIQTLEPSATFFPPATELQLAKLETTFNVVLPDELKHLLLESNGVLEYGFRFIWSIEEIIEENRDKRTNAVYSDIFMPFDNLLFFSDAGNGDQFAFPVVQGRIKRPRVFAWDHENDSRTWVAESLKSYIEGWLTGKIHT
jgi:hypothetical protein